MTLLATPSQEMHSVTRKLASRQGNKHALLLRACRLSCDKLSFLQWLLLIWRCKCALAPGEQNLCLEFGASEVVPAQLKTCMTAHARTMTLASFTRLTFSFQLVRLDYCCCYACYSACALVLRFKWHFWGVQLEPAQMSSSFASLLATHDLTEQGQDVAGKRAAAEQEALPRKLQKVQDGRLSGSSLLELQAVLPTLDCELDSLNIGHGQTLQLPEQV